MQLLTRLLKQVEVVFCQPTCVYYHLREIRYVLLYRIAHLLDWNHMVPVVLVVHAGSTDCLGALFAKVLDTLVRMDVARYH